jgi:hypothetical protein
MTITRAAPDQERLWLRDDCKALVLIAEVYRSIAGQV